MTIRRSRQADLVDRRIFDNTITVIGCGAIGSFTTLTLAKMGFKHIKVFDNDTVEEENIANQFYRYSDIGTTKTNALSNMIQDFEQLIITPCNMLWTKDIGIDTEYVVMAVDSMTVRKEIYDTISRDVMIDGFVDGRMGGQQAEVYAAKTTAQKKFYKSYLWDESEASELPCTQKAVMYNVLWIASTIANTLRLMMEDKPFRPAMYMDFENQVQNNLIIG